MTDATIETEAKRIQSLWKRWLLSWMLLTFWIGLTVPLLAGIYYRIRKPSDFDSALSQRRTEKFAVAMRVGTASCSNDMGIQNWSSFGVNAGNADFEKAKGAVWNGTLREAHLATYLGWSRDAHLPTIFTICRRVKPDGETIYSASENGLKPIARYLLYCFVLGGAALIFLEVVGIVDKRRNQAPRTEKHSRFR